MKGVERSEGNRKGLGSAGEDRPLKEDEIDRLQPLGDCRPPGGRLFGQERTLQPQAVQSSLEEAQVEVALGLAAQVLAPGGGVEGSQQGVVVLGGVPLGE